MKDYFIKFGKLMHYLRVNKFLDQNELNNSTRIFFSHEVRIDHYNNYEKNIQYIIDNSNVLNPQEFFENLNKGIDFKGKNTMFSFDDGLLSSYNFAKKVLNDYKIKAIFFIPTYILNIKSRRDMKKFVINNIHYGTLPSNVITKYDYELMNIEHLEDLCSDGHMVFPHTHNHIFIKDIKNQVDVKQELVIPQQIIQKITNNTVKAFAFPVGTERQVSEYAYNNIKEYYDYCFTAFSGLITKNSDYHKLYRSHLPANAPSNYLKMLLDGVYDLFYKFKMNRISSLVDKI